MAGRQFSLLWCQMAFVLNMISIQKWAHNPWEVMYDQFHLSFCSWVFHPPFGFYESSCSKFFQLVEKPLMGFTWLRRRVAQLCPNALVLYYSCDSPPWEPPSALPPWEEVKFSMIIPVYKDKSLGQLVLPSLCSVNTGVISGFGGGMNSSFGLGHKLKLLFVEWILFLVTVQSAPSGSVHF